MSLSVDWPVFSVDDKEVLRKSWSILNVNLEGFGILIYEMIFEQCPDARLLFPFMKQTNYNEKKSNKDFAFQALRFVQIFETAIKHLDDLQSIDGILDNLGRRHGRLKNSIGFKQYYWTVFRECALYNIRKLMSTNKKKAFDAKEIDDAVIQWRILIDKIIEKIERGYETDLFNRSSSIDQRN